MNVGLLYAVCAALLFGGYLVLYKRFFGAYPTTAYMTGAYATALCWYLPLAALSWPDDAPVAEVVSAPDAVGAAGATALLTGVAIVVSLLAVNRGDVTYVTPLNKLVPLFVLPIEVLALGQYLGPWQVGGVVVATAGIYVANYRPGALLAPFRRALSYTPAQLALAGAALFGVADVAKRVLLQELALPVPFVVWLTLLGVLVVAAPLGRSRLDALPRRAYPGVAGMGLLIACVNHVNALAFQAIPASVASPIVNSQAVVAVVVGGVVLDEGAFGKRLVASVLAVVGVVLVALG
ncbi:DMT family transporter [Halomarina ordinaria]|uniref:EamA family transporter n=1 Tax=Halomarina ordinaria TaxID=3033939 RepID=A0ABD5UBE1_9EURY|nr:DMT family transporter [Halomarina sp. PSRA2]